MAKEYKIPFGDNGDLLSYPESWKNINWRDNYIFSDVFEYNGYSRGRSSALILFKSITDGREYPMFMTDFDSVARKMVNGVLKGEFTFQKRGQNYGVKMVPSSNG